MNSDHPLDSQATLTQGPIARTLVNLTRPMVLGVFSSVAFNLTGSFFIAQLRSIELAAISFTFPVMFFLEDFQLG